MILKLNVINYPLTKNRCYKQNAKRTPIGIQVHTIGTAQGTAKAVADYWNQSSVSCMTNYICDADEAGRVYKLCDESVYTWADGGYGNRNLITMEIAESDFMKYTGGANYTVTDQGRFKADVLRGYETAVLLCADICKRYKWDPMKKLSSGLYLISSHDEGRRAGLSTAHVDPTHLWPKVGLNMDTFRQAVVNAMKGSYDGASSIEPTKWYRVRKSWADEKSQLGAYEVLENAKNNCPYLYSVFDWDGNIVYTNRTKPKGTIASEFAGMSEGKAAEKIIEMIHNCDKSGILYSVSAAQMILESGYVTTNLAKIANNCFGMKTSLSGNTWTSVWDGKSCVVIDTQEEDHGKLYWIKAKFRKYPFIEDSIKDHSCYLLGAMNGSKKRYEGLLNCKNYREAITLIKKGGYATDSKYVDKICSIIQRFNLDRYDSEIKPQEQKEEAVIDISDQYFVQANSYKVRRYADAYASKIKEKGIPVFVKTVSTGDPYRVICGVFSIKKNAEIRKQKVMDAGFSEPKILTNL